MRVQIGDKIVPTQLPLDALVKNLPAESVRAIRSADYFIVTDTIGDDLVELEVPGQMRWLYPHVDDIKEKNE